jgi:hypothetical protein
MKFGGFVGHVDRVARVEPSAMPGTETATTDMLLPSARSGSDDGTQIIETIFSFF